MSRVHSRVNTHGIGHNGANAMTKLLHSSVLSDMLDRLISDQEAYIAHLLYIAQELKIKKKVARYRPVITVYVFISVHFKNNFSV